MKIKKISKKKNQMTKKITKEDLQTIAVQRNHSVVSFENYENVHSPVTLQCHTCSLEFTTTVHSYKNAKKTGFQDVKRRLLQKPIKGKSPVKKRTKKLEKKQVKDLVL